jgi:hypothetical protein
MNNSPAREHYLLMRERTPRPEHLSVDMEWRRIEMLAAVAGLGPWEYYARTLIREDVHTLPDSPPSLLTLNLVHRPDWAIRQAEAAAQTTTVLYGPYIPGLTDQTRPWWRLW